MPFQFTYFRPRGLNTAHDSANLFRDNSVKSFESSSLQEFSVINRHLERMVDVIAPESAQVSQAENPGHYTKVAEKSFVNLREVFVMLWSSKHPTAC